ncbi:uncharacterized protein LOC117335359, partial [Pecten maximus]|uniref:uncharacterized protein LOC117335359 n=1 Tax=Pecten maximus TaxID=6579 RepID=UPI00145813CC
VYTGKDRGDQGNSQNLTECESQYVSYPRGANCYCTRYSGCYHQHFQVKPQLVGDPTKGGVYTGKDRGVHNHDYIFEVTATNNALVNTTHSFKITIDTTPPHVGYVMEGQRVNRKWISNRTSFSIHTGMDSLTWRVAF